MDMVIALLIPSGIWVDWVDIKPPTCQTTTTIDWKVYRIQVNSDLPSYTTIKLEVCEDNINGQT